MIGKSTLKAFGFKKIQKCNDFLKDYCDGYSYYSTNLAIIYSPKTHTNRDFAVAVCIAVANKALSIDSNRVRDLLETV
jgi:hypothetical protein